VPTIAAIDGYAFGGGLEVSLACDLRVATPDATVGLPEVGLRILPGGGGTQRLAHVAGAGVAKDLIFTGRAVDAEEAATLGIVNRVYERTDEFDDSVRKLAETIAANAPWRSDWRRSRSTAGWTTKGARFRADRVCVPVRDGGPAGGRRSVPREARSGLRGALIPGARRPSGVPRQLPSNRDGDPRRFALSIDRWA